MPVAVSQFRAHTYKTQQRYKDKKTTLNASPTLKQNSFPPGVKKYLSGLLVKLKKKNAPLIARFLMGELNYSNLPEDIRRDILDIKDYELLQNSCFLGLRINSNIAEFFKDVLHSGRFEEAEKTIAKLEFVIKTHFYDLKMNVSYQ